MLHNTIIAKNKESVLLHEKASMAIDRIKSEGTLNVRVPTPDMLTLARVIVLGEGSFEINHDYSV